MSKQKLSGKALVVQITRDEIRIARMSLGTAAVQEQVVLPTPPGAVEDGQLVGLDALRDAMAPVLRQGQLRRCRKVVFVLCSTQVISESVTVPVVKKKQRLGQMLVANMDEYFPVNPGEYQLSWQTVGKERREDSELLRVQLWAVPRALLNRYYALANSMGLSVAAVDFCGHSIATAVGAGFAAPAPKRGKAAEPEVEGGTCLYVNAESELLLLTFVQNGQVKLQRLLQRGYSQQDDLNETAMVLDYFAAMPGQTGLTKAVLSGGQAEEDGLRTGLAELLNVSVQMASVDFGPQWLLCQGASRTELDFGSPEMNHLTGVAAPINRAWQYGLIFLGGAALTASVLLLLTSKLTWNTELEGLRNTENQLMIMAQKDAGNAERYQTYSDLYDAYSGDWDRIFDSVRTYNDNLELVLGELENKLPKDATVTALSTADQGLAVQVAFQNKEDAAYFLVSLRNEPYMTIKNISSLTIGPSEENSPANMISMLYQQAGAVSPVPEADTNPTDTADAEQGIEAPPTEGGYSLDGLFSGTGGNISVEDILPILSLANGNSSIDGKTLRSMVPLLEKAGADAGTVQKVKDYADMMERYGVMLSPGNIGSIPGLSDILSGNQGNSGGSGSSSGGSGNSGSSGGTGGAASGNTGVADVDTDELRLSLQYLTSSQLDALQKSYGPEHKKTFKVEELLKSATQSQQRKALRSLLNDDPAAMYKFFLLMREDIDREEKDQILYYLIFDDIWENADMHRMFYESDQEMLDEYLPKLLNSLTGTTKNLKAAETLIQQDKVLSEKLAFHLAEAIGQINGANTALDLTALQKDIDSGAVFKKDADTVDAVKAMLRLDEQPAGADKDAGMDDSDLLMWLLMNQLMNQNGGSGIPDIFNTGSGQAQEPADNRYYLTLVMGYDEALIQAEQARKGLNRDAKVEKVEVAQ